MAKERSFFACAAIGSTKVYVAGGHDDQKNALQSAEVYDVEKDEWETLPPMAEGRDECHGVAMTENQGFCVLSGYGIESQGQFRSDAEVYDPATNCWTIIKNVWPFSNTGPRGRTAGGGNFRESKICCFTRSERQSQARREIEDKLKKWKVGVEAIQLPVAATSVYAGSLGGSEAVVMGGGGGSEEEGGMVMMRMMGNDDGNGRWVHIHTPLGFSSLPFSHASICL